MASGWMDEDARVLLTALGLGQKAAARSADGGLRALRLASANRARREEGVPVATAGGRPSPDTVEARGVTVASWCPTPEPTVPPVAVALVLELDGRVDVGMLLRTPEAVEQLIAALRRHRLEVWPMTAG